MAALHKLKDFKGNYPIIIVDDEAMMRGVDYRSDIQGIVLVVDKSFDTRRDALQGLTRVGRFGDECVRILVKEVELFNPIANSVSYQAFFRFAQSIVPKKPIKRNKKTLTKSSTGSA